MMKIDMRPPETQEIKKEIHFASGDIVFVAIIGMNPMHAVAEIKAAGGRIRAMDNQKVSGSVHSEDIVKTCESLLANGWEWRR